MTGVRAAAHAIAAACRRSSSVPSCLSGWEDRSGLIPTSGEASGEATQRPRGEAGPRRQARAGRREGGCCSVAGAGPGRMGARGPLGGTEPPRRRSHFRDRRCGRRRPLAEVLDPRREPDRQVLQPRLRRHGQLVFLHGLGGRREPQPLQGSVPCQETRAPTRCRVAGRLGRTPRRRTGSRELFRQRQLQQAVWEALGTLPEREREAIVLTYCEGRSTAEVAATLHVSPASVRRLVHRATYKLHKREELREWLTR